MFQMLDDQVNYVVFASSCQRRRLKLSRDDGKLFPETCGGTSKLPKEIVLSNFSLSDNKNSEVCRCITCMICDADVFHK